MAGSIVEQDIRLSLDRLRRLKRHLVTVPTVGHHVERAIAHMEAALGNWYALGSDPQGQHARVMPVYRENPHLMIYNPPLMRVRRVMRSGRVAGMISDDVHDIRYTHVDDGKDYQHPFESDVLMLALDSGEHGQDSGHDILLTGKNGQSLWEDFG
jgi:hypothetical protein